MTGAWTRRDSPRPFAPGHRIADLAAVALGIALLLVVAGVLGVMSAAYGTIAILAAILILFIGLASTDVALIPLASFAAVLVPLRAGPMSVADLVLIVATVPAFLLYRREEATGLQPLLWLGIAYQALLVPTLLLNPYTANLVEWFHELFMVVGSLLVGWVVGRHGLAGPTLRLYALCCSVLGAWALGQGLVQLLTEGSFGPVYLLWFHKNFIGDALAFAFLIAFLRPDWLGWRRRFCYPVILACGAGIAASQSRQAMISVVAVVLLMSLRGRQGGGGRGRVLLLAMLPGVWFVFNSVSDQYQQFEQGNESNSLAARLVWFGDSLQIWKQSPVFGVGLRWWYTSRFEVAFQPPNALFEMLSSAGVVGTAAFLVMCLGGLWYLLTIDPRYGNLAAAVLLCRFIQGQLDLYWLAGLSAIPWMMAGLVLGAQALHERGPAPGAPAAPG